MQQVKRSPAADLIRILALFLVISVHFFLNNGFYTQIVENKRMYVMTIMRSFFIICVPLFIMLSGYLLRKKQLEKSYYKRIFKIVITYLLASLMCVAYAVVFQEKDLSAKDIVLNILKFKAAKYSWYIEMYMGLFLLIPFLNIAYNNLPSKKSKIWLIISMVILTSLPAVLNIYDLTSFNWLAQPSSTTTMNKVIPAWWQTLYPVTYYFIGCYLSEYGLKINKALNFLLILLWGTLSGIYCCWRSYKVKFISGAWCSYQSLFNVVLTLLVFVFIININYDKTPRWLAKFMQKVSGLSLGAYLVSWIFDSELYPVLAEKVPVVTKRLEYYVIIVPALFVLSLLASWVLSVIQLIIEKCFSLICGLFRKKSVKITQVP